MIELVCFGFVSTNFILIWMIIDQARSQARNDDSLRRMEELLGLSWSRDVARRRHPSVRRLSAEDFTWGDQR